MSDRPVPRPVPARLSRALPAGVIDSSLASLATFATALYASAVFAPELLGVYALYFMAFITVSAVAAQLLYIPAEVAALAYAGPARLGVVARSLRLGAAPTAALAVLLAGTALVTPPGLATADLVAFTVTGVVLAFLSPIQDHVRRMHHVAGSSWAAAVVSAVQVAGTLALLGVLTVLDVGQAWVPFGALAGANVASLGVGLALVARLGDAEVAITLGFGTLARSGRWLVVAGTAPAAGGFVASALVSAIAGSAALGFAEAARVVAQPVYVLATGIQAVLGPRSMEAGAARDSDKAAHYARIYALLIVVPSAAYIGLVGFDVFWNPATYVIPKAYVVGGLVMLTIVANTVAVLGVPPWSELIGGRREAPLAAVETLSGGIRGALGGAAGFLGSHAVPWSLLAYGVARLAGLRPVQRSLYRAPGTGHAPGGET